MSSITRTWLGFCALGAGLIHLALVISSPVPIAVALAIVGFTELGWSVLTFSRERIAAPRLVMFLALVPILLWGVLVATASIFSAPQLESSLGFTALGISSVFELVIAIALAIPLRRGVDFSRPPRTPKAWRYLTGLLLGALVVGALTTPALASTEAGKHAHPHGSHTFTFLDPHAGH